MSGEAISAAEIARTLEVPFRHVEPADEATEELTHTEISFFKVGDSSHTKVAADGTHIPIGEPVEQVRRNFGGDEGVVTDPFGKPLHIRIPPDIRDGEGNYLSVAFYTRKKVGP